MAQPNNENGSGIGCLLALLGLGLALAYWPIVLAVGILTATIAAVGYAVLLSNQQQLKAAAGLAERRLRQDPCIVQGRFGVIESITVQGELQAPTIQVVCRTIGAGNNQRVPDVIATCLTPPAERNRLRVPSAMAAWLRAGEITLLDNLSVEARAVRAAMECIKQRQWTTDALSKLTALLDSVVDTLNKAKGNELLESSIPQLRQALAAFQAEEETLRQAHHSAGEMLRKLQDFLSVPDGIRPILTFDLEELFDPERFAALEQSFSDVVLLNDAFRELSRDAKA
jgi:hypothetical protein